MNLSGFFEYSQRLNNKNLSLTELRRIEDEVLLRTEAIGNEVLPRIYEEIEAARLRLMEKKVACLMTQPESTVSKIAKIYLNPSLTPSEIEEEIESLVREVGQGNSLLDRLAFQSEKPLAHEFDRKSIQSTFTSRMQWIAKEIIKENSSKPYQNYLNSAQQGEIARFGGKGMSPEVLSHAVEEYIRVLSRQVDVAQELHFGRLQEAAKALLKLPQHVQERVYQRLVVAILEGVEEQMGINGEEG